MENYTDNNISQKRFRKKKMQFSFKSISRGYNVIYQNGVTVSC